MRNKLAVWLGRAAAAVLKLRGGGSAVPGRVAEAIAPRLLEDMLRDTRVVFITASNGKTSTTRMAVSILQAHGWSVFTNRSGANMGYGITASLLKLSAPPKLAVLEVDEGHAEDLARRLRPEMCVFLNLQVDQLNRYHDPAKVRERMLAAVRHTQRLVILNADDPQLVPLQQAAVDQGLALRGFSASEAVRRALSSNGLLPAVGGEFLPMPLLGCVQACAGSEAVLSLPELPAAAGTAAASAGQQTSRMRQAVTLPSAGAHQALNAAAAFSVAFELLGEEFSFSQAAEAVAALPPAFGRGERITVAGQQLEIMLMKNPRSLQVNLDAANLECVMIGIDEGTPDPSWLYDIDFSGLSKAAVVTGSMAWQTALCLSYRGIQVQTVEPDLPKALELFLAAEGGPKTMLLNYEVSMKALRHFKSLRLEG